jgi:mannose-6-phosphate isomerase-like protein (cupin superfamily)
VVTEIRHQGQLLAIILPRNFEQSGIHFLTSNELTQQLAYMCHPAGKVIKPHIHVSVPRQVEYTSEVLFIKRGKVRVDFFDNNQNYLESRILETGDTMLLVKGGHGFEALEELEMIEVKQGPYAGEQDKIRFAAKLPSELNFGTNNSAS